jgi:hypothetical protein
MHKPQEQFRPPQAVQPEIKIKIAVEARRGDEAALGMKLEG